MWKISGFQNFVCTLAHRDVTILKHPCSVTPSSTTIKILFSKFHNVPAFNKIYLKNWDDNKTISKITLSDLTVQIADIRKYNSSKKEVTLFIFYKKYSINPKPSNQIFIE